VIRRSRRPPYESFSAPIDPAGRLVWWWSRSFLAVPDCLPTNCPWGTVFLFFFPESVRPPLAGESTSLESHGPDKHNSSTFFFSDRILRPRRPRPMPAVVFPFFASPSIWLSSPFATSAPFFPPEVIFLSRKIHLSPFFFFFFLVCFFFFFFFFFFRSSGFQS